MSRHAPGHRCPPLVEGDVGNRAELIAVCLVLAIERGARYERPQENQGKRTPDWWLDLPDGRRVALEVTSKRTNWRYEYLDGIKVGTMTLVNANGDRGSFDETLRRTMKDKYERGQLAGDREKWLCVQLDETAGSQLDNLFKSLQTVVISPETSYSYDVFPTLDFSEVMATAAEYGYDEVWCITQSWEGPGTTLVLRFFIEEKQWSCFCLTHLFHFEPPCHDHYPVNHHGYIATRLTHR